MSLHIIISIILIWSYIFIVSNTYEYTKVENKIIIDFDKKWNISILSHFIVILLLITPVLNIVMFCIFIYGYITAILSKKLHRYKFYPPWKYREYEY